MAQLPEELPAASYGFGLAAMPPESGRGNESPGMGSSRLACAVFINFLTMARIK